MESAVCKEFAEIVNGLAGLGNRGRASPLALQNRRARLALAGFRNSGALIQPADGAYATSLLRELCQVEDFSGADHAHL